MKTKLNISLIALINLVAFSSLLYAEDYFAEADFFGESPEVLTVSRMHKPLQDSPASVSVIDRQMIRNSGAREIADLFRMVPGFIVGHLHNNRPVVSYNGFGLEYPRELQVLIDGRSVFIPSFGGVPWTNLPLLIEDIERIEIIRGPSSVTYGANAFLASINIITRHSAEDLGGRVTVTQDLDNDSSAQDIYFRYGHQLGDFDWRITAGREKDDGYANRVDSKLLEKLNIRADFLSSYNQFWSIQAGINQGIFSHGTPDKVTDPFREENTENHFINVKWEIIEDLTQTTLKLTHTNQDVNDSFQLTQTLNDLDSALPAIPVLSANLSSNRESNRSDLEIYQNRSLGDLISINYGISVRQDRVKSFFLFHDNETKIIDTSNFFTSVEWKPDDNLILDFGLLIEDTSLTDKEESFRLSVIKTIDQHSIRFVSSSAVRNPTLWELNGNITYDATISSSAPPPYNAFSGMTLPFQIDWINSENLKSESILSHEIGMFSHFLDRQITTDIKLFQYEISDHITETEVSDSSITPLNPNDNEYDVIINGGKTKVEGLEFSFNYSPIHQAFRLYGGLSVLNSKSFDSNFAHSVPAHTLFTGGHYQINPRQQISTTVYQVDDFSWVDRGETIDGYTKLDLRYQVTLYPKNGINLELIGQNLLEEFSDYRNSDTHEKSFLIKLSGQF